MTALPFRAATAKIPADQAKRGDGASGDNTVTADDTFEHPEEHDYSLLRSHARSNTILKTGAAALLTGLGVGAAAFGISYAIQPKVIETTKVVTETKIERIEIPKIVEKEVIKTVEIPKIIDRPVAAAPPPATKPPTPAPEPGQRMSKNEFENTSMYRDADKCKGVLVSHIKGVMTFENGSTCRDVYEDGRLDPRLTTSRNDGDLVTCNDTGKRLPNGKPMWNCYALHNGRIESVGNYPTATAAQRNPALQNNDLLDDLFR
jgi:hypothetical protein